MSNCVFRLIFCIDLSIPFYNVIEEGKGISAVNIWNTLVQPCTGRMKYHATVFLAEYQTKWKSYHDMKKYAAEMFCHFLLKLLNLIWTMNYIISYKKKKTTTLNQECLNFKHHWLLHLIVHVEPFYANVPNVV